MSSSLGILRTCMVALCHRMLQMSLLMGLYRVQEASGAPGAIYTKPLEGRVWKVLEMSTHLYTMVEGMRGVQGFLENSRDFLYIGLYIELCRVF